jgi:hypothetical protein
MEQKIFLLQDDGERTAESIHIYDAAVATKLVTEGRAVPVDIPNLDEIERQIDKKVDRFRREIEEIKRSDDPKYKVEGAMDYYSKQLREKLEAEVTELQVRYEGIHAGMLEAAKVDLANQSRFISETERHTANSIVNEAITAIKYGNAVGTLDVLLENASYYTETRKQAVLGELARLSEVIKGHAREKELDKKIGAIYHKLNASREAELIPVKIAQALSSRADTAFSHLKKTHIAFREQKDNMHNPRNRQR